jgi:hypothetical protein
LASRFAKSMGLLLEGALPMDATTTAEMFGRVLRIND